VGIDISGRSMAGRLLQLDEKFAPLMKVLKEGLYHGRVIHIGETRPVFWNVGACWCGMLTTAWMQEVGHQK